MSAVINNVPARLFLLLVASLVLIVLPAAAQQRLPRLLSYQGVLADSKRTAVPDGTHSITFRLYAAANGGSVLWEETHTVPTVDGVFEAILGSVKPLEIPFDRSYWVGLQLTGEPEMMPRVRFVSAPYSFRSLISDTALHVDPQATGVVRSLNNMQGDLVLVGEGRAGVRMAGDTLAIVVPGELPAAGRDGQTIRWNASAGRWEAVDAGGIVAGARISGDGSAASPLDIARMGATNGQVLLWSDAASAWQPGGLSGVQAHRPIRCTLHSRGQPQARCFAGMPLQIAGSRGLR